ncbi:Transposase_IS4 [Hexamita inflata]|uniref:Transposase_IS4 n=1 Tax=Hexamita inflata TaxID=28002 RepID=A0ABP1HFN5_9EUKA
MSQIRYPYKCCRWTSRMWIYSIQAVIINSFQLFKRQHREHAQISIRDYIIGLVQQIQENRIKYEIRYQFYFNKKQRNQPRQPKCKQLHVFDYFRNHHRICVAQSGLKCKQCKCKYSRFGCSCDKKHGMCEECYNEHIIEQKIKIAYTRAECKRK